MPGLRELPSLAAAAAALGREDHYGDDGGDDGDDDDDVTRVTMMVVMMMTMATWMMIEAPCAIGDCALRATINRHNTRSTACTYGIVACLGGWGRGGRKCWLRVVAAWVALAGVAMARVAMTGRGHKTTEMLVAGGVTG